MALPCLHAEASSSAPSSAPSTAPSSSSSLVLSSREPSDQAPSSSLSPAEAAGSSCICHIVVPPPATPHDSAMECRLCHRNLFQTALENAMDALDVLNEKLVTQKNACELLQAENDSLHDENQALHRELELLRHDNEVLAKKLITEAEQRAQLLLENDMITLELNELTEKLFFEANNLVSTEARLRSEAESSKNRAVTELEEARKQLLVEQEQLKEFKEKIEAYAAEEEDLGHFMHSHSLFLDTSLSDESLPASPGAADHPHASQQAPHAEQQQQQVRTTSPRRIFDARLYVEFAEFLGEIKRKNIKVSSLYFMKRCAEEDIEPCLRYVGRMALRRLQEAFLDNSCFLELHPHSAEGDADATAVCSACECKRKCMYRYRLREGEPWKPIDRFCRDRIVAVGDFYAFVRHLQLGLFKSATTQDLYHECSRLRRQIFYARVGALHLFPVKQRYFAGFVHNERFGERDEVGLEIHTTPPTPDAEQPAAAPAPQAQDCPQASSSGTFDNPFARLSSSFSRPSSPLRPSSSQSSALLTRKTSSNGGGAPARPPMRRSMTMDEDAEGLSRSGSLSNLDSGLRRMSSKLESAFDSLSSHSGGSISISVNSLFSKKPGQSLFKSIHKDLSQLELDLETSSA